MPFLNRAEAGRRLADELVGLRGEDVVVLGLPRGGVPVAYEVARALDAPLDVIVVRKLGVPFQPELGMGAIGEGGVRILNPRVVAMTGVSDEELATVEARERTELERRARRFREGREQIPLAGRTAVVIDDGIATGSTARAACLVARAQGATKVILAVPVAPPASLNELQAAADDVLCLETPWDFFAIGQFYADFTQTTDDEVIACLTTAARRPEPAQAATHETVDIAAEAAATDPPDRDEEVEVHAGPVHLGGHLTIPQHPTGIVIFAHGSGSSRHSPRNRYVASVLNQAGLGTLLFDLLTPDEEHYRPNVFDIDLLARRLVEVTAWLQHQPDAAGVRIGYFGASTGAAAALAAAAAPDAGIAAVVSRGGRPDLAGPHLGDVRAPTLLIVGGFDDVVLELNRAAERRLRCVHHLAVVPGATHLFEEPGTLLAAAALARDWFLRHLAGIPEPAGPGPHRPR